MCLFNKMYDVPRLIMQYKPNIVEQSCVGVYHVVLYDCLK